MSNDRTRESSFRHLRQDDSFIFDRVLRDPRFRTIKNESPGPVLCCRSAPQF